jgi:vanillate O-demethylase monooxygenase subunit
MKFLRNCWYLAAWSDELTAEKPFARTILEEVIAFFRKPDGSPAAVLDQCPHRFAPLSAGTIDGGSLRCRYHGLAFDGAGRCSSNPHGPITGNMKVKSYPVVERFRGIWIWMGDAAKADPSKLPDLEFLESAPATAFNCGYLHSKANYQLWIDNILDLSHTDFLHPDTLGGGAVTETKAETTRLEDGVDIKWITPNRKPAPLLAKLFEGIADETDVWQEVRWWAPGVIRLLAGAVAAGRPRTEGFENRNVHIMTPETANTNHYLFAATRNFRMDDEKLNQQMSEARRKIFSTEDLPMIEACQAKMGERSFWDMKPILLGVDAGPVLVRRVLDQMIAAESVNVADHLQK